MSHDVVGRVPSLACLFLVACGGTTATVAPPPRTADDVEAQADPAPSAVPSELAAETAIASRQNSDWIVIGGFDVALRLPVGWHRQSAERMTENRQRTLQGDSRAFVTRAEPGWRRTLQVAATERPLESAGGLVPTIQINLRELPPTIRWETLCGATAEALEQAMRDVTVVTDAPAPVGPLDGRRCTITYTLDTVGGPLPVEADTYFVWRAPHHLQISFSGPPPLNPTHVQGVLGSVRRVVRSPAP